MAIRLAKSMKKVPNLHVRCSFSPVVALIQPGGVIGSSIPMELESGSLA